MPHRVDGWVFTERPSTGRCEVLSQAECSHAVGMRSDAARDRYLAGRVALRDVVGAELRIAARDVALVSSPHGPVVLEREDLRLSLSHAGALIAVALCREGSVGIDVEVAAAGSRRVPTRAVDSAKLDAVAAFVPESFAPLAVWVAQEAALKADGIGLGFPLEQVRLRPDNGGVAVRLEGRGEWGAVFHVLDGVGVVAVATRGSPPTVAWQAEVARWLTPT